MPGSSLQTYTCDSLYVCILLQGADAQIVGVASMPMPHAQQVATVALDSQGFLHLFFTPLSTNIVVWDAHMDAPAAGLAGTGQQGMSGAALSASRAAEASQDPERAVNSSGSGERCRFAVPCQETDLGPTSPSLRSSLITHQC